MAEISLGFCEFNEINESEKKQDKEIHKPCSEKIELLSDKKIRLYDYVCFALGDDNKIAKKLKQGETVSKTDVIRALCHELEHQRDINNQLIDEWYIMYQNYEEVMAILYG